MAPKKTKLAKTDDSAKTLTEKREALRQFRFHLSGGKVKNIKEGRELRRDIARMLTAQNA